MASLARVSTTISPMTATMTFSEHTGPVTGVAILDPNHFITGSADRSIKVWERNSYQSQSTRQVDDKERIWYMQLLNPTCVAIGWSPGDLTNHTIRIHNTENGQHHELMGHQEMVDALAVSKEGLLASGAKEGSIKIWEPLS